MELYDDHQLGAIVSAFQRGTTTFKATSFMIFFKNKKKVGVDIHGMPVHTSSDPDQEGG